MIVEYELRKLLRDYTATPTLEAAAALGRAYARSQNICEQDFVDLPLSIERAVERLRARGEERGIDPSTHTVRVEEIIEMGMGDILPDAWGHGWENFWDYLSSNVVDGYMQEIDYEIVGVNLESQTIFFKVSGYFEVDMPATLSRHYDHCLFCGSADIEGNYANRECMRF